MFALGWAFWFVYMLRYPRQWAQAIDGLHVRLGKYGLSVPWMRRLEKGPVLMVIVAATTFFALVDLVILIRHPTALSAFLQAHHLVLP
jgi:hypothetical protein